MQASGRARLQVLFRLLEEAVYLQHADAAWANAEVLGPVLGSDEGVDALWSAIAQAPVFTPEAMRLIGARMANMTRESKLPATTRGHLAQRVFMRVLWDREAQREPSVDDTHVQQMLRLGDDGVRAGAARMLREFVKARKDDASSPEERFRAVVKPVIEGVWPKELSLRSRPVSDSLAGLPARCGRAFAEAVWAIERFLTPFDCWSLYDYRMYGDDVETRQLQLKTKGDAKAFLRLLDLTVGEEETAIVPHDLERGLAGIEQLDAELAKETSFRRLLALVRR